MNLECNSSTCVPQQHEGLALIVSENPRVRKSFCPQFWGRKWLHQFYGRLEKCVLSEGKNPMSIKFRVLGRGGAFWFWEGGGGSADFIFMGARIFLIVACVSRPT